MLTAIGRDIKIAAIRKGLGWRVVELKNLFFNPTAIPVHLDANAKAAYAEKRIAAVCLIMCLRDRYPDPELEASFDQLKAAHEVAERRLAGFKRVQGIN